MDGGKAPSLIDLYSVLRPRPVMLLTPGKRKTLRELLMMPISVKVGEVCTVPSRQFLRAGHRGVWFNYLLFSK
jgi:hypothetical protein